jgi:hypothetical protein
MDSNSIARTERNSLSFRQLVHPGCQNAFSVVADIGFPDRQMRQLRAAGTLRQWWN